MLRSRRSLTRDVRATRNDLPCKEKSFIKGRGLFPALFFSRNIEYKRAFINPGDYTKRNPDFPDFCVFTFSKGIIYKFASLNDVEIIGQLYTANGSVPVYRIVYKVLYV